jgi:hypothetical protein
MSEFIESQRAVIDQTGSGLLPGIGLALVIAVGIIATILLGTWWSAVIALVGIFAVSAVVVAIIWGLIGSEEEIYGDR